MTRCVIYCRFSPRPDANESTSNVIQEQVCRDYAKLHGWEVVVVYEDADVSGDSIERPGLWNAVAALKKGDVLLCWKLDRLARDVYLSLTIENQVTGKGARIVSVSGEGTADQSPEEVLIRRILQALAEYQKAAQAAQTKARMLHHQANGRRMGRPDRLPYGWKADPADPARMVTDIDELETIGIIKDYDKFNLSSRDIADRLNAAGHLCRGKPWNHQLVCRILARSEA